MQADVEIVTETDPDGWIYDVATGEVLGRANIPEGFTVQDDGGADWVLERRSEIEADIVAARARKAAVIEQMDRIIRAGESRLRWWDWKFRDALADYARRKLKGAKSKTIRFAWGSVSFRRKAAKYVIRDQGLAVAWMKNRAASRIKTATETWVTATDVAETCIDMAAERGNPPNWPEWLDVTPAREAAEITTGVH